MCPTRRAAGKSLIATESPMHACVRPCEGIVYVRGNPSGLAGLLEVRSASSVESQCCAVRPWSHRRDRGGARRSRLPCMCPENYVHFDFILNLMMGSGAKSNRPAMPAFQTRAASALGCPTPGSTDASGLAALLKMRYGERLGSCRQRRGRSASRVSAAQPRWCTKTPP